MMLGRMVYITLCMVQGGLSKIPIELNIEHFEFVNILHQPKEYLKNIDSYVTPLPVLQVMFIYLLLTLFKESKSILFIVTLVLLS